MAAIIAVIGNSSAGKTTLANALAELYGFQQAVEEHNSRPFQSLMAAHMQEYACLNQIDYLLFRAEQQKRISEGNRYGIIDGGLDEDYYLFTKLFLSRGYLSNEEYQLCDRLYQHLKGTLPQITLSICVDTPVEKCVERYRVRNRTLEVAQIDDLHKLDQLLKEWLDQAPPKPMIRLDGSLPLNELVAQATFALKSYHLIP